MQKLNPKSIWIFFFRFLFAGLFPFIILFLYLTVTLSDIGIGILEGKLGYLWLVFLVFVLFFVVFCWVWAKLTYRFWAYQLTEDVFKKEYGVIWKKYVSIPYEKIQNVDINRGIIARILGLSDLHIQTAGASAVVYGRRMAGIGAEGYLPGLSIDMAEQLREELIKKAKGTKQGL
jgi:uncharacterized membrane protein YdbT with pleckstrin-like domain